MLYAVCGNQLVHEALVCKGSLWVEVQRVILLLTRTRFETSVL